MRERIYVPAVQLKGRKTLDQIVTDLFMAEVLDRYPTVLDSLANTVTGKVKKALRFQRATSRLPASYHQWAQEFRLESEVIAAWACETLTQWNNNPGKRRDRDWIMTRWGVDVPRRRVAPPRPSNFSLIFANRLDYIEAHPELESKRAFMLRAKKHWEARMEFFLSDGNYEATPKIVERHLAWLTEFHIGRKNYSQIAASESPPVGQPVVAKAVKRLARLLDLKIRVSDRGRPRAAR